jgi:1,4-alpha-glucan branching enzyme
MKRNDNHTATMGMPTSRRRNHKLEAGSNTRPVEVELTCEAPQAETVFVAGDFNQWRAHDLRLRQDETGTWKVQVWLAPGPHEYRFIVDGEWQDDPHASARVPNAFGSNNCVLQVPPLAVTA